MRRPTPGAVRPTSRRRLVVSCLWLAIQMVSPLSTVALARGYELVVAGSGWRWFDLSSTSVTSGSLQDSLSMSADRLMGSLPDAAELIPFRDPSSQPGARYGFFACHSRGIDRVSRPAHAPGGDTSGHDPAGEVGSIDIERWLVGKNIDGAERLGDGSLLALEHPRAAQGEGKDRHAILAVRARMPALPETVATASPAAYDLFLLAGDSLAWVSSLSGRTLEPLHRVGAGWREGDPLRVDLPGFEGPKDDALVLLRLLFPRSDGSAWLFEQGREAKPRLLELAPNRTPRVVRTFPDPFQARNGALVGDRLALNAGRRLFLVGFDAKNIDLPAAGQAVAISPDGRWIAVILPEARDDSRVALFDGEGRRVLTTPRLGFVGSAVTFLD